MHHLPFTLLPLPFYPFALLPFYPFYPFIVLPSDSLKLLPCLESQSALGVQTGSNGLLVIVWLAGLHVQLDVRILLPL